MLDLDQVTLQEAPLPPPIQRVMDPGQSRMFQHFAHCRLLLVPSSFCFIVHIFGFSDAESATMTPDAAELTDRLDLSMSSIDMTNTALAMQEEKECEISGVGKFGRKSFFVLVTNPDCFPLLLCRRAGGQHAVVISGQSGWPTGAERSGSHGSLLVFDLQR